MAEPESSCLPFTFSFAVKELMSLHCQEPLRSGNRLPTRPNTATCPPNVVLLSWCAESQECLLVTGQEEAGAGLG